MTTIIFGVCFWPSINWHSSNKHAQICYWVSSHELHGCWNLF